MTSTGYDALLGEMRTFFSREETRPITFRKQQLLNLKKAILAHEEELYTALYTDLKKNREECWVTELGIVLNEINTAIKNMGRWMEPDRMPTNLVNLPSSSRVMKEPLGVVLIIGPWNYPFQLLFAPLVGAIAAGNCVVLKSSEHAPATAAVMQAIIEKTFAREYIVHVTGDGAVIIPALMQATRFDHIFYTGGIVAGKIIYKMAAENLIPVTLELGGKSPCVIESDANIKVAARRIAVTKFINAGQTCIAPDYLLVHRSQKEAFLKELINTIQQFFSTQPEESYNYGRVINAKQFDRLVAYFADGDIVYGGRHERDTLFIEPTVLANVSQDKPLMTEEIFGPLLPVLEFTEMEEAKAIIQKNPNPLAFYVFTTSSQKEKEWLESVAFGGGCVNNASWHFTNHHLPFGGRGMSGIGRCHGRFSFDTFSHQKSVLRSPNWFDPAIKYPSFKGKLKLFKWMFK